MASNHLINEKSPYLLQHADNPVNWYPWGRAAFQKAEKENKPIFLSIGYATCHWCHVMAHECFEDEEVARLLNEYFISIKVDREERPDVDSVYMYVCQALTGRGGWPLSVFIAPDGKPFFAGTYFPKTSRMGIPGFVDILRQIASMWKENRFRLLRAGEQIADAIQPSFDLDKSLQIVNRETLENCYNQLDRSFDRKWAGFGEAPKFPTPHRLTFLLRWYMRSGDYYALEMVEKTLDSMRKGGIYDHIGFGFHRYSVDEKWLVPHFEKMLYDQALLAIAYTEAYQATGEKTFGKVAKEIFEYVLRDMTAPEGGFYCAEDADSEGKEGLFYLWSRREVKEVLGEGLGELFSSVLDITKRGNFEDGLSIPHVAVSLETFAEKEGKGISELEKIFNEARETLFNVRRKRIQPLKDDKILTSWNGLMVAAFAKGDQVFGDDVYSGAAKKAADFIFNNMRDAGGRLLRRYRQGSAEYPAYLDDYAFLVWGLIELYESTFEVHYLENAIDLNDEMTALFWDNQSGGLFFTGEGNEELITRIKDAYDGAVPSGNSTAALNFLRLGRMTGRPELEKKGQELVQSFSKQIKENPISCTQLMNAIDFMVGPSREIVISGDPELEGTREMLRAIQKSFLPNKVLLLRPEGDDAKRLALVSPFTGAMEAMDNRPTAYVCEQYSCQKPVKSLDELINSLQ